MSPFRVRIIAMYSLYFLMVSSFFRDNFFDQIDDIWLDDMPYVDRIYHICLEIYLCREMVQLEMEEELFAKLVFIMRSREIAIKVTRDPDDPYNPNFIINQRPAITE